MSDSQVAERLAANVVTSDNLANFNAQKLGLAAEAPTEAVENTEPVVEAEEQSEQPEASDEAKATEERKQNPKLEKRFSEITKQREQAREEARREREAREQLESRLRELEQRIAPQQTEVQSVDQEPQPSQFNDAFEYAKALAEYSTEKALKERDRQEAERRANEERDKVLQTWSQKIEAVKSELPDFEEMVQSADVAVPDYVRDAIIESEVGPKVLYHLAENPDYARQISQMNPAKALRELGKLEARFEVKSEPAQSKAVVTKSKAPNPISPIKATSSVTEVGIGSDGQFHGTYQQWREARKAGKIR